MSQFHLKPEDFNHPGRAVFLIVMFALVAIPLGYEIICGKRKLREKFLLVIAELLILTLIGLIVANLVISKG